MGKGYSRSKYGNKKCDYHGLKFDSMGEMQRYFVLCDMADRGEIKNLKRQIKFPLSCNGHHICDYIADFVYDLPGGEHVVEDYKGVMTDVFKIKAKLFMINYGFKITISNQKGETKKWPTNKETTAA